MKKRSYNEMTLLDFEILCEERRFGKYTYSTYEQEWDSTLHTCTIQFEGGKMLFQHHPNQVVLQGEKGELRFERVEYVKIYSTSNKDRLRFGIMCGSETFEDNIEYILSAAV